MPLIRSQRSQKLIDQESKILLAIQAIKKKEIHTICEAARHFNVTESILHMRLHGTTIQNKTRANSHKLTEVEKQLVVTPLAAWAVIRQPSRVGLTSPGLVSWVQPVNSIHEFKSGVRTWTRLVWHTNYGHQGQAWVF